MNKLAPIILAIIGVALAYQLMWIGDDIFITLRYVQNWIAGNGIVYNVGEYVEGYTHPLWLLLTAACSSVGLDPVSSVLWMGLISLGVAVYLVGRMDIWAGVLLVTCYDFRSWATGGLETMFFTALIVGGAYAFYKGKPLNAGICLALAVLTRPDGVLFALVGLVYVLWQYRSKAWLYLAPFVIVVVHELWRIGYYGDWLPNTFYAKSAGSAYWSQGLEYLYSFVSVYPSVLLLLLVVFRFQKSPFLVFLFVSVVVYLVGFVLRVGGDYMFARFLIPVLPLAYLAITLSLKPKHKTVIMVFLCLMVARESTMRDDVFTVNGERKEKLSSGIVDEAHVYTRTWEMGLNRVGFDYYRAMVLKTYFVGESLRVALRGGQAALGYFGEFSYLLETSGLTDRAIAKRPLAKRGQPGHERAATLQDLRDRRIHFVFFRSKYDANGYVLGFDFGGVRLPVEIITRDEAMISRLKAKYGNNVVITK